MKLGLKLFVCAVLVLILVTEGFAQALMYLAIMLGLELWDLIDKINEVIKNPDIRVMRLEAEIKKLKEEVE